jgi:hypothetical protein
MFGFYPEAVGVSRGGKTRDGQYHGWEIETRLRPIIQSVNYRRHLFLFWESARFWL